MMFVIEFDLFCQKELSMSRLRLLANFFLNFILGNLLKISEFVFMKSSCTTVQFYTVRFFQYVFLRYLVRTDSRIMTKQLCNTSTQVLSCKHFCLHSFYEIVHENSVCEHGYNYLKILSIITSSYYRVYLRTKQG